MHAKYLLICGNRDRFDPLFDDSFFCERKIMDTDLPFDFDFTSICFVIIWAVSFWLNILSSFCHRFCVSIAPRDCVYITVCFTCGVTPRCFLLVRDFEEVNAFLKVFGWEPSGNALSWAASLKSDRWENLHFTDVKVFVARSLEVALEQFLIYFLHFPKDNLGARVVLPKCSESIVDLPVRHHVSCLVERSSGTCWSHNLLVHHFEVSWHL